MTATPDQSQDRSSDQSADQPSAVRRLDTPEARELADLAAVLDDLRTVLRCCERLVAELSDGSGQSDGAEPDDLVLEAMWTTALLSYTRCFTARSGLTEQDIGQTSLQGEVLEWHRMLRQLREHYTSSADNPRERFSVGAAQDGAGQASGIAITSTSQPRLDDLTVRQTGALAYELSQLVGQRIDEHEERVRAAAGALSRTELERLPRVDLTPEETRPGTP